MARYIAGNKKRARYFPDEIFTEQAEKLYWNWQDLEIVMQSKVALLLQRQPRSKKESVDQKEFTAI
jgi:hypothetical protein